MPTYVVYAMRARLAPEAKARIAAAITDIHAASTGAPAYFAQVLFQEVGDGDWFVGGAPLGADQIFVHGHIRDGRTPEIKRALLDRLLDKVAEAAGAERGAVWCYVAEMPPTQMAEFGHVLPPSGGEAAWAAALPPEERARMEPIGRR
jgi:phenylpyruvate tautomerase PptA (4-oxalocrotonate tautomerase family)